MKVGFGDRDAVQLCPQHDALHDRNILVRGPVREALLSDARHPVLPLEPGIL